MTDTPGSVLPCRCRRGSSGHPSTDAVARPPAAYPGTRAGRPQVPCLALLRVGFTEPPGSPGALVVSYTTVSPLPVPVRDRTPGGLFSVALSCGLPRVGVTHHPALRSPDVPRATCVTRGRLVNPSGTQSTGEGGTAVAGSFPGPGWDNGHRNRPLVTARNRPDREVIVWTSLPLLCFSSSSLCWPSSPGCPSGLCASTSRVSCSGWAGWPGSGCRACASSFLWLTGFRWSACGS